MRTTLTIDDTIVKGLKRMAGKRGTSLKAIVNEALREGLRVMDNPMRKKRYRTKSRPLALLPGIDPYKLGQIADEVSDLEKLARSR